MTAPTIETTYKVINGVECKLEHYTYFYESGVKARVEFYANGLKHNEPNLFSPKKGIKKPNEDDKIYNKKNGDFKINKYTKDMRRYYNEYYNVMNTNDHIAVINYDKDGHITSVENWVHGQQLPVHKVLDWAGSTHYAAYGMITKEIYFLNGLEHNVNGYSYRHLSKTNNNEIFKWKQNGKFYCTDGPAYIKYYKVRGIQMERAVWYNEAGEIHRDDGYAVEVFMFNNVDQRTHLVPDKCQMWRNGKKVEPQNVTSDVTQGLSDISV